MNQILAFFNVNIKLLLKDKISFVWSVLLPTVMLLFNKENVDLSSDYLVFWWVYIVFTSFIFGVGIEALHLRENGSLRIVFSVNCKPMNFFLGNLLTQIAYSVLCITIFNIIAMILLQQLDIVLLYRGLITIVYGIPVAFLGYNVTLLKKVHVKSITAIVNIAVFFLFIITGMSTSLNQYNPINLISMVIVKNTWNYNLYYVIGSLFIILISMPSILTYSCISNERR